MLKWYKLEETFPEGDFVEQIKVNGKKLCLVRHQQHFFVVQNSCPHAGGILSGGTCKNGYLICPIHRWEYNLQTGRGAEGQGDYIDIYPVETRSDGIYVGLKESWIKKLFS
ncbi:Rieske (2Fe-2S) protein [Pedobacter gandavensis]|uniref:Rieske (2Fe-2S) protein n=1 Tax=Pedobacter gandavensis TaxID=2679963 RepID=UPI00292D7378|nr:Rieske (2Fe-2S) protein [Pedobacter gandavensis]